jgi:hypothetical protein
MLALFIQNHAKEIAVKMGTHDPALHLGRRALSVEQALPCYQSFCDVA